MNTKIVNLPIHNHPVFALTRFIRGRCFGCHVDENIYNGYLCNEYNCFALFHKECAEAPSEINHPSHPEHPILLTNDSKDGPCDFCGEKLLSPCYSCSTCEFKVDLICGMKPSPLTIEHLLSHDHPLALLKKKQDEKFSCSVCKECIDGPSYSCVQCNNVYFHVGCVHLSKEINYPCHTNHPLKLINASNKREEKMCILCQQTPRKGIYHCSICNFTVCVYCTKNPPPLVVEHTKTHKHPLTLFSRKVPFTCDACGEEDNGGTYLCLQCTFVIHGKCINLPRVISINRHDHRISFTYHLGTKYLNCGVCRKSINQYHGGYTCSVCPKYATHSRCVVNWIVWDGVELEGIPYDDVDDSKNIVPFKPVGDNLISHFSHRKHPLRLYINYIMPSEWIQCDACMYQLGCEPFYFCEICGFVLHKKCASLPRKKRLIFDPVPFKLNVGTTFLNCDMCRTLCDGFMYTTPDNRVADVHCGSLSEPFNRRGHPHPLYFVEFDCVHRCDACESDVNGSVLCCDDCEFKLCFYCASLPEKIWYRNDEHILVLYCGENSSYDNYWCDSCEMEINRCKWFYTCSDCGVTLHARCVLGDFSRLKLGSRICFEGKVFKVVLNNHNTRPICRYCHSRCKISIILENDDEDNKYICSRACLLSYVS